LKELDSIADLCAEVSEFSGAGDLLGRSTL
jgi:hypothetical protein